MEDIPEKPAKMARRIPWNVEEVYPDSISRQWACFRLLRPHPGAISTTQQIPSDPSGLRAFSLAAQYADTRGIDTLFILIRKLTPFGISRVISTDFGASIYDLAMKDIGWDRFKDWAVKGVYFDALNKTSFRQASSDFKSPTYNQLLEFAPELIRRHSNFQLYNEDWLQGASGKETWSKKKSLPGTELSLVTWSGEKSLVDTIQDSFIVTSEDGTICRRFSIHPLFIRVRYSPTSSPYKPFREMRHLALSLPRLTQADDAPGICDIRMTQMRYNICAVVRLAEGTSEPDDICQDDIRTYRKDGCEIVPAEVGIYQAKDEEATKEIRWTVESSGTFDLYFYRVAGWRKPNPADEINEIDDNAPEYEERSWIVESRKRAEMEAAAGNNSDISMAN